MAAVDFALGTPFVAQHPWVKSMLLRPPYILILCGGHGDGRGPVSLEHSTTESRRLCLRHKAPCLPGLPKTEEYHLERTLWQMAYARWGVLGRA